MKRLNRLVVLIPVAVILTTLALQSFGQGPSQDPQPSSTNKSSPPTKPDAPRGMAAPQEPDFSKRHWELPADADKTKNPVASSEESIAKGKELYGTPRKGCVFCHGESGAGNQENLPKLRRKPADLSNKERMTKITDGEAFWKITLGIDGIMPGREKVMTEEERWHVVNYVRTLAVEKKE